MHFGKLVRAGASAGAIFLFISSTVVPAHGAAGPVKSATAITEVFGDGQKLTAIALEYDRPIDGSKLSPADFRVDGRTIVKTYASASPAPAQEAAQGRYVIVELSLNDPAASSLRDDGHAQKPAPSGATGTMDGPPQFGPRQIYKTPVASVTQVGPIATTDGTLYAPSRSAIVTSRVKNLIVDDFRQLEYRDRKTGGLLKYNLFVPKGYDKRKAYPLVLFMHDAGTLSHDPTTTLKQGLGAVIWASPADQAKHPAFVLAPQYVNAMVNDQSEASPDLDTTVDLVEALTARFHIDRNRLYTTGQSMGAMTSIAMDIKYPQLFAASFIVAGQWNPALVKPLARQKLWIVVSQGDLKAYPGENDIANVLEQNGAKVSRAVWNGRSTPEQFALEATKIESEGSAINYIALEKGTVVPPGQPDNGGSNHMNTWRIAYTIEDIRDWIFRQHR